MLLAWFYSVVRMQTAWNSCLRLLTKCFGHPYCIVWTKSGRVSWWWDSLPAKIKTSVHDLVVCNRLSVTLNAKQCAFYFSARWSLTFFDWHSNKVPCRFAVSCNAPMVNPVHAQYMLIKASLPHLTNCIDLHSFFTQCLLNVKTKNQHLNWMHQMDHGALICAGNRITNNCTKSAVLTFEH